MLKKQYASLQEALEELELFEDIFENLYDGVIMIDKQGLVTMISDAYCKFLGIARAQVIGRHVTEIIENTRLHIVLKTGQAEIGSLLKVKGQDAVVMRIPIWKNGQVEGVVGKVVFRNISELGSMAKRLNAVESQLIFYRNELKRLQGAKYTFKHIIGKSPEIVEARQLAAKAARTKSTVLILGASGTGKELFAHAIHEASPRAEGPFVRLNCATIPKELIEAELFGYEEGTFTGAVKGGRAGKIEISEGGTLFLDEIGDMPLEMQVKLLRFLQEKEVQRLGGNELKTVDVRVIAATNRPLEELVQQGLFREDLFYRLNVVKVRIPPLSSRAEDVSILAQYILGKLNNEMGTTFNYIDPQVEELFHHYHWPGNVRELHNVLERSINVAEGNAILFEHLPLYLQELSLSREHKSTREEGNYLAISLAIAEKKAILHALKTCNYNRTEAAKYLGIHRTSLYRKIDQYHLSTLI